MMKKPLRFLATLAAGVIAFSAIPTFTSEDVEAASGPKRYTVLILDASGSMSGTPEVKQREAAKKFCEDILSAPGKNYVSLLALGDDVTVKCEFTKKISKVEDAIDQVRAYESTNFSSALKKADQMLDDLDTDDEDIRNIVFCSDGVPCSGMHSSTGKYTSADSSWYSYGNAALAIADDLKAKYNIYTLGFFHSLSGKDLTFGRQLMQDMASYPNQYYDVTDPDNLSFEFGNVAQSVIQDNDPIILLPGIMGSELFLDPACKKRIWSPGFKAVTENIGIQLAADKTLYVKAPANQNDLDEKDRETGAADCMKELINAMCDKFPNREVYLFSYDWRKSNEESAKKLREFINDNFSGRKVDIVAHSMGGLVTSKYFKEYGSDNMVDKIVTCGTPYEGSPHLIEAVVNFDVTGDWQDIALANACLTKDIKSQFDGVVELIPTDNYISSCPMWQDDKRVRTKFDHEQTHEEYVRKITSLFGETKYNNAVDFQYSLHGTGSDYNVLLGYDKAYFVMGTNQKTLKSFKFDYHNDDIDQSTYDNDYKDIFYTTEGDGTVPFLSASIMHEIEKLDDTRKCIVDASHVGTIKNSISLNWIGDILAGNETHAPEPSQMSHSYMVIRIACPVDVTIADGEQVLSSVKGSESFNSSFGRLDIIGKDNDIKMICMDEDTNLDVNLTGTGTGTMTYSVRHYSANDELLDERVFENVPITEDTVIKTKADNAETTVLNVDNDGDGVTDETWTTEKNEDVTVPDSERIAMNGIKATIDSADIKVNDTAKITVVKDPETSTDNMTLTFTSSDENIATVDFEGNVKAVNEGTAIITVTSSNGFKQEVTVTVKNPETTTSATTASTTSTTTTTTTTSTTSTGSNSPKTGDTTPISAYMFVIISLGGVAVLAKKSRKDN